MLPTEWHVQDEMYNFKSDPRDLGAVVILSANESSYVDTGMRLFNQGVPHPTAWYQEHGAGVQPGGIAGRSFYSSLGHLNQTWEDMLFMEHIMGGVMWTLQANTTRAFNATALVGNAANSSTTSSSATGASSAPGSTGTSTADGNSGSRPSNSGRMLFISSSSSATILLMTLAASLVIV